MFTERLRDTVKKVVTFLVEGLSWASAAILLVVMFLIVASFLSRDIFGKELAGIVEFSATCLVAIVFLGLAYAQAKGAHVKVDLVTGSLGPRKKPIMTIVGLILSTIISGLIIWKTGEVAWNSFLLREYRWGLISFPLWPARWLVPIGFSVLCFRFIVDIRHEITHLRLSHRSSASGAETEIKRPT